jgi:hypothetical protein
MRTKPFFDNFNVEVNTEFLLDLSAAFNAVMEDFSRIECTVEECGCPWSMKAQHAASAIAALDTLLDSLSNDSLRIQNERIEA